MGVISFLKKIKGGNFGLIARNIASIYFFLNRNFPYSFPDEASLLATAGVIDTFNYRALGESVSLEIIKETACEIVNNSYLEQEQFANLNEFIIKMEQMIFFIDCKKMDHFTIIEAVRSHSHVIYNSTQEVLVEGNVSGKWEKVVEMFMISDRYLEDREQLGLQNNK